MNYALVRRRDNGKSSKEIWMYSGLARWRGVAGRQLSWTTRGGGTQPRTWATRRVE